MKIIRNIVSVVAVFALITGACPVAAVTFQQVPTAGGQPSSGQPVVTGQSNGSPSSGGGVSGQGGIVRDNSATLSRSAANQVGEAYRDMSLTAVEAYVDLSNFIYADPDKTSDQEMEIRYDRCMESLDDLEKKAKRVNQAVDMVRITSMPLVRGEMAFLLDLLAATPAEASLAPGTGSYSVNQRGMLGKLSNISRTVGKRVGQLKKGLPSSKVNTEAVREQVGRWLSAVKAGAGVIAGAATFVGGVTLVVTATPVGIAVGIPLAVGGLLGGVDSILTGTEDMQSVSTDDLGYEMLPPDSPERKAIAKGAKIGNYISIVTSAKSAGEFVTSVLQAPGEAMEAAGVVGSPVAKALGNMIADSPPSTGSGIAGGSAELAGPEPPLCPGTYIGAPGMKPGHIDKPTSSYKKVKKAISDYRPGFGRAPSGKDWWEAIWDATGANDGGEGEGSGGCGCGH